MITPEDLIRSPECHRVYDRFNIKVSLENTTPTFNIPCKYRFDFEARFGCRIDDVCEGSARIKAAKLIRRSLYSEIFSDLMRFSYDLRDGRYETKEDASEVIADLARNLISEEGQS